jgi:hypothetical protein
MNVPKAFFTRRVGEAIESLALHVTSARNIAASLKPIKTAPLGLEEEEEPRPIITSIDPAKITDTDLDDGYATFTISGKNLAEDSVKSFALFLEDNPSVVFKDNEPEVVTEDGEEEVVTGFTATVNLGEAPHGFYEVRITDENDTPHLPGLIVGFEATRRRREASRKPNRQRKSQSVKRKGE